MSALNTTELEGLNPGAPCLCDTYLRTGIDHTTDEHEPTFAAEPMTLAELTERVWQINVEKGWTNDGRTLPEDCALLHSEVSEILEEFRHGHEPDEIYYSLDDQGNDKPEGIDVELADYFIRGFHFAKRWGIDLERALEIKLAYNAGRPFRHGDKRL